MSDNIEVNGEDMRVYIHDNRAEPTFMIPVTDEMWLVWVKREAGPSEWTLKNINYIRSMREKFPEPATTFDVAEQSKMLEEANPLDVLLHTTFSIEQVRDEYIKNKKVLLAEAEKENS